MTPNDVTLGVVREKAGRGSSLNVVARGLSFVNQKRWV